jgi:hypothetical protein
MGQANWKKNDRNSEINSDFFPNRVKNHEFCPNSEILASGTVNNSELAVNFRFRDHQKDQIHCRSSSRTEFVAVATAGSLRRSLYSYLNATIGSTFMALRAGT